MKVDIEVLANVLIFPFSFHYAEQFRVLCNKNAQSWAGEVFYFKMYVFLTINSL